MRGYIGPLQGCTASWGPPKGYEVVRIPVPFQQQPIPVLDEQLKREIEVYVDFWQKMRQTKILHAGFAGKNRTPNGQFWYDEVGTLMRVDELIALCDAGYMTLDCYADLKFNMRMYGTPITGKAASMNRMPISELI